MYLLTKIYESTDLFSIKTNMIKKAIQIYGKILPVRGKPNFYHCFTIECNKIIFWFNLPNSYTTKVLIQDI
jgi:hypothetical protein